MLSVLRAYHSSLLGGHHSGIRTAHKTLKCGYNCPTVHQDAHDFTKSCDQCQRDGGISKRQELPLNTILVNELFHVFMGLFSSYGMKYVLVAVDYMSKWVEAIAQLNNERKSVTAFLKKNMLSRFDTPRAIISDGGSHFCKKIVQGLLEKYVLVTMWLLLTTYKQADK